MRYAPVIVTSCLSIVIASLLLEMPAVAKEKDDPEASYVQRIPGTDVSFNMVALPGGLFRMGSPEDEAERSEDEGPQVDVRVAPFWMGKHEVTWAEYKQYMRLADVFDRFESNGVRPVTDDNRVDAVTAPSKLYDPSFTYDSGEDPSLPAVTMSQYAAKQYSKWLSLVTGRFYRLPTEAEWEYACRAGSSTAYSFGNHPDDLAKYGWFYDNSEEHYGSSKVGLLKPNAWGLYDMHGNVAEWVLDGYNAEAYDRLAALSNPTALETVSWPTQLFPRVLRGGSWLSEDPAECRAAARMQSDDEELRSYDPNSPQSPWWLASDEAQAVGFRIVRPLDPPPRTEWSRYWDADVPSIEKAVNRRIDHEGRGERGFVDQRLPDAIESLGRGKK